jgi:hypothetical protein
MTMTMHQFANRLASEIDRFLSGLAPRHKKLMGRQRCWRMHFTEPHE